MLYKKHSRFSLTLIVFTCLAIRIKQVNCEDEGNCTLQLTPETEFILIPSSIPSDQKDCKTIHYVFEAKWSSSIINITSSRYLNDSSTSTTPTYPNETVANSSETNAVLPNKYIFIVIKEESLRTEWNFTDQSDSMEKLYLSRSSSLLFTVQVEGNWIEESVQLSFEEVEFRVFNMTSTGANGVIDSNMFGNTLKYRNYRPNSVYIYQILKPWDMDSSNVVMKLIILDVDEEMGEYLLIGAGSDPFHGPPPLFLSNKPTEEKLYRVDDENAYIIFVTASTRKKHDGFRIEWSYDGERIYPKEDNKEQKYDDVLQSIQVCIYNYSAALTEFRKSKEDRFQKFRKELALISSAVARNNTLPETEISSSKISFYRISAAENNDKIHPDGLLYVMLKIEGIEKGEAAFSRVFLQKSFDLYYRTQVFDDYYTIAPCPKRKPMSSQFYVMIPILCCFLTLIWIWKQKPFSDYFMRMVQKNASVQQSRMSRAVEDNYYSTCPPDPSDSAPQPIRSPSPLPIPKVGVIDEEGRRQTLVNGSAGENFDNASSSPDPDTAHIQPRSPTESGPESTRNRSRVVRAEINRAFNGFGERLSSEGTPLQDTMSRLGTENVYYSLRLPKTHIRNVIHDTKL